MTGPTRLTAPVITPPEDMPEIIEAARVLYGLGERMALALGSDAPPEQAVAHAIAALINVFPDLPEQEEARFFRGVGAGLGGILAQLPGLQSDCIDALTGQLSISLAEFAEFWGEGQPRQ